MGRSLDKATLVAAAEYYAGAFMQNRGKFNRDWVINQFYKFRYKDEFDYLYDATRAELGTKSLQDFDRRAKQRFTPRNDDFLAAALRSDLAITPEGDHIEGVIGTTVIGQRVVGRWIKLVETSKGPIGVPKNLYWPIYAGEGEERAAGSGVADPLPEGFEPLPLGALNTRMSNALAIVLADAIDTTLSEGAVGPVLRGYTGAQPTQVDDAASGTLLFELQYPDPGFGAAADAAPGGRITANTVPDDTINATGTVGYCRLSSADAGSPERTINDDHLDGEAGTTGADFNFNSTSLVAGADVSLTSHTITVPES